jgi:putative flippase GtrA
VSEVKRGAPLRFLVVGAANTLVGLLVIYTCKWLFRLDDVTSNVIGYMIALANSFFLNRAWTFANAGPVLPAMVRFLGVFVVAYLVNLATVMVAIDHLQVNAYLAQACGIAPYTVVSYLGSRYFAFRTHPAPARARRLR